MQPIAEVNTRATTTVRRICTKNNPYTDERDHLDAASPVV
jgi:hypothetical protein